MFDLSKKFAHPDTFLKSKNYCTKLPININLYAKSSGLFQLPKWVCFWVKNNQNLVFKNIKNNTKRFGYMNVSQQHLLKLA